jgi:Response regulator containing CheY-like receiver, AAA-type ATPase, and DNA-binding domains
MNEAKTILIVDDDVDILEQYALMLKADGYNVVRAGSLAEAEETILTVRPDLAVLDLMMDEKDAGFVLCNQLKRLYANLPVIIVSNVTPITGLDFRPRNQEEHSWVRADAMLAKPVTAERLRGEISRLLNQGQTPAATAH